MATSTPTTKGKPRGRNGGRPATLEAPTRHTVTLDQATLAILNAISTNLSEAIRTLARQSQD